jgi:uncharacterized protein YlxW (UPF0749 family)
MTGGQMMVVLIVAIVMIASIIKSRQGYRHRHRHGNIESETVIESGVENRQLREEVKQLKERLAVLERITVEKENSLEREIEKLRDK